MINAIIQLEISIHFPHSCMAAEVYVYASNEPTTNESLQLNLLRQSRTRNVNTQALNNSFMDICRLLFLSLHLTFKMTKLCLIIQPLQYCCCIVLMLYSDQH